MLLVDSIFQGEKLSDLKAAGVRTVLRKQDFISSFWSTDKALWQQINFFFPLGTFSDKWEFDMTLSKSEVMKMQPACACVCIAVSRPRIINPRFRRKRINKKS